MPRFLGIDYGLKRIGLAVGDTVVGLAAPIDTIEASGNVDDQVRAIQAAIDEYGVDELVIGLPLHMDGAEGKQAKITRAFGLILSQRSSKPAHFWDERLSSAAASDLLNPIELTRKRRKNRHDAVAAQVILQEFLDAWPKPCGGRAAEKPP